MLFVINPYTYPNNDPINFIDPYGLCGEGKDRKTEIPWWEKLEKGYYYGTGFGEEALEYYVQRWLETGNWLWAIPAGISALWTPKTYQNTASLLITAASLSGWAAQTGPTITWRGGEIVVKSGEKTIARGAPLGHGSKPGQPNPWYRRLPHYHRRGPGGIGEHRPWQNWRL